MTTKYYCPRAYTDDCNKVKCSIWGTPKCVDGMLNIKIVDESEKKISCPRAYSPNCNGSVCSLWGTPKCVDGNVKIEFAL
jgi:hypothetical protein